MGALLNMSTRIRFRRDTAANWTSNNPTLTTGELGYETDTGKFKIGNNTNAWTALPYSITAELSEGNLNDLKDVTITSAANGDFLRWNGTAWINDAVNLATDTVGSYVASLTAGTGITLSNNSGEEASPTVAVNTSVIATRAYVEATSSGLNWHDSVNQATTAALPYTPTYSNGTAGVGATLTGTSNARLQIDGINTTTNQRVLVKNQASGVQNGIYVVTNQGSVSVPFVLTRVSDFDSSAGVGVISSGEAVYVVNGATNAGQGFVVSSSGTGTGDAHIVNTDAITFTQFTGTSTFVAGDGLSFSGNTVNVATASSGRIVVNADSIDLASGVSSTGTYKSVTVDTYGRVTGGTNPTTLSGFGITDAAPIASPTFTGTVSGITASMVGLNLVDNVSDANKPISTATQTALDLKANLASPTFTGTVTIPSGASISGFAPLASPALTGTPTAPTASALTNTTQVATTAYVDAAVSAGVATVDQLDDLSDVTAPTPTSGDLLKWNGTAWVNAAGYALLASPTFTGTPTLPTGTIATTQTAANSTTAVATTAFVTTADNLKANLASPTFTGTVTIPSGASISGFAPLASPALTGTPTAPTAATSTNTTQVATTAFVRAEVAALVGTAGATLDTLGEIATALGNDANLSTTLTTSIGLKAPLASPTFTGTPLSTTAAVDTNTTQIATTAYVVGQGYAKLASPTFTGTVTLPSGTVTSTMILDGTIANADISTTAAIDLGKLADVSTSAQTASYTLVLADKNKIVEMGVATANTLTVPPNASVAYAIGSQINILQTGAGQTTVTAGAGVTINAAPGLKMRTQWSYATLVKRATDTWVLVGDISA